MWQGWRLFCGLIILMSALTAVICWLTIPDFTSIASLRIDGGSDTAIMANLPDGHGEDVMLYLPSHGGRVDVALGDDRVLGAVPDFAGSQLTRERFFGAMTIPADLAKAGQGVLRLSQRGNFQDVAIAPAYLGPRSEIAPVVEQQQRFGRIMQVLIPFALLVVIAISFLLIFFSRQPLKFMLLIVAFSIQLVLEIADEPLLSGLNVAAQVPFLSTLVNGLIGMAIAIWTSARRWQWRALTGSMVAVLAMLLLLRITGLEFNPFFHQRGAQVFALWIVLVQVLDWAMLISDRTMGRLARIAGMATLFLGHSGLLAYHLLNVTRPGIELTFFLSNWTNVATSGAVLLFIGGALVNEVFAYRVQRGRLVSLESIVSGHNAALDEQAIALRDEIQRGAVLEERQRFLRDMHDGLGGQLLTLLLRLRRYEGGAGMLADDVQAIIGDLRLMTSALDGDEVSLVSALERLRVRIEMQCRAAGIALDWNTGLPPTMDLPVGEILNLLRIVEEAATNAVRHSGCRTLSIRFGGAEVLQITVSDDGRGFARDSVVGGAGLRSIEHRVTKLAGTLSIDSAPWRGARFTIMIPIDKVNQTGPTSPVGGLHALPRSST